MKLEVFVIFAMCSLLFADVDSGYVNSTLEDTMIVVPSQRVESKSEAAEIVGVDGLAIFKSMSVNAQNADFVTLSLEEAVEFFLNNNRDIRRARLEWESKKRELRAAWWQSEPELVSKYSYGGSSTSPATPCICTGCSNYFLEFFPESPICQLC